MMPWCVFSGDCIFSEAFSRRSVFVQKYVELQAIGKRAILGAIHTNKLNSVYSAVLSTMVYVCCHSLAFCRSFNNSKLKPLCAKNISKQQIKKINTERVSR